MADRLAGRGCGPRQPGRDRHGPLSDHSDRTSSVDGRRVTLEVHERGVLRVDLTRGLPVRHTRERIELRVEDGVRVVRNTVALAARDTAVAGGEAT